MDRGQHISAGYDTIRSHYVHLCCIYNRSRFLVLIQRAKHHEIPHILGSIMHLFFQLYMMFSRRSKTTPPIPLPQDQTSKNKIDFRSPVLHAETSSPPNKKPPHFSRSLTIPLPVYIYISNHPKKALPQNQSLSRPQPLLSFSSK